MNIIIPLPFKEEINRNQQHTGNQNRGFRLEQIFSLGLDVVSNEAIHNEDRASSDEPAEGEPKGVWLVGYTGHVSIAFRCQISVLRMSGIMHVFVISVIALVLVVAGRTLQ
jgi:hypothetical protein